MYVNLVKAEYGNFYFNATENLTIELRKMIDIFTAKKYYKKDKDLYDRFIKLKERLPDIDML